MNVITKGAETVLLEAIGKIRDAAGLWYGIHFRFSKLQPDSLGAEHLKISLNLIEETLSGNSGTIFLCFDRDVFVICQVAQRPEIDKVITEVRFLYANDPLACGADKDNEFCTIYDLRASYEDFVYACNRKALAAKEQKNDSKTPVVKKAPPAKITIDANKFIKSLQQRDSRKGLLILVAEDHPFSRQLITHAIGRKHEVIAAKDGKEAIDQYAANAPDIMFLDIEMPVADGHKVLRAITEIDSDSFIIMLTANTYEQDVKMAIKYGAKGFIAKPFTKQKMESYIQQYLTNKK